MKIKIGILALTTVVIAGLCSCTKSGSTTTPSIEGKWFLSEDSSLSTPVGGGNTTPSVTYYAKANRYTNGTSINITNGLWCDSTYYTYNGIVNIYSDTARYSLSGNTITVSPYNGSKYSFSGNNQAQVSVNGNTLIFNSARQDTTFTYTPAKTVQSISNVIEWAFYTK